MLRVQPGAAVVDSAGLDSVVRMGDEELLDEVLGRTRELAVIPAPLGEEAERAAVVAGWWRADGLAEVHGDAAGNVLALLRPGRSGRSLMLAAHLDTVFPRTVEHALREQDGRLHGPGVGDNTVAVAALAALRHLVLATGEDAVWLVATTGEEGLGNLRGAKHLVASRPDLAALVAVEGSSFGELSMAGQGSVRARIAVAGPGGHSWADRDRDSAVHGAARAIALLDAERPRTMEDWAWHAASITGGGDINVLASEAAFTFEVRAPDDAALEEREARARALVAEGVGPRLAWSWSELGRRPGGSVDPEHPLVRAAIAAHEEHGCGWRVENVGTDANAAYGAGLPAITMGVATGGGIHTPAEWLEVARIPAGLRILASTVARVS